MKFPDVRQLREMHWCVPCLPFSSAARMQSAQPFKASQRRFKPSSTAIIKLAQKPLIATDSLVLKLRVISRRATCAPNVRDGNRTQREADTGFTSPCSVRTVGTVRAPTAERCRIKVHFRRRRARRRARHFEDGRDAALVVQDGFCFEFSGAIFTWRRKCFSESRRSQDRLGMEMVTFARCGFSGYGYALDPVRRDRGACSLGES